MLNDTQRDKANDIWKYYESQERSTPFNPNDLNGIHLDKRREEVLPEVRERLSAYLRGHLSLEQFKTENDSINKRNRLWGFKGMNGQMFYNMLYNTASGAALMDKFDDTLKNALSVPGGVAEARARIDLLVNFSVSLADYVEDKRQAPRAGSSIFFLSYFWQIQDHLKWPIYYSSMVNALTDESLWAPAGNPAKDYESFFELNHELKELFGTTSGRNRTLWDVEHAFWGWAHRTPFPGNAPTTATVTPKQVGGGLPSSYIPPVVNVLPLLAKNDPAVAESCNVSGISPEKAFEERLSMLFKMLGFCVESLGQGYGRVPDGIAISQEFHYAIIYDAKMRGAGYSIGTDDRAIREYILHETERLKRQGIRNVYFAVISGSFCGDFDDTIRSLKIETEIREILLLEASALITLLEEKLRRPELDLGPKGIQGILAQSGIITDADMKEFLGV
jgi:hypothetical protein